MDTFYIVLLYEKSCALIFLIVIVFNLGILQVGAGPWAFHYSVQFLLPAFSFVLFSFVLQLPIELSTCSLAYTLK